MFFRRTSLFAIVFDSVATIHLLVGIFIVLLGEYTSIFIKLSLKHGGVEFVLRYLDYPVYSLLIEKYLPNSEMKYYAHLKCFFILVVSSVIYGLFAYLVVRFIKSLFESD